MGNFFSHAWRQPDARARRAWQGTGRATMAGLVTLPLAAAALAGPAHPADAGHGKPGITYFSYYLTSGSVFIRAGGHTWKLLVNVSGGTIGGTAEALIQITTPRLGGEENHDWITQVPMKDLAVNRSAGKATVSTGTAMSPLGSISVSFTPTSHTKATCASGGAQTTYTGKMTGSVRLVTGLKHLVLSKKNIKFGSPDQLQVSSDFCVPSPCSFASWAIDVGKSLTRTTLAAGLQVGIPGKLKDFAEIAKIKPLAAPKGALRDDGAILAVKAPRLGGGGSSLSAGTSSSGIITGSISMGHAKTVQATSNSCTAASTRYSEKVTTYSSGRYSSPSRHELEARTLLTGDIKLPASGEASWVVITSIKKK